MVMCLEQPYTWSVGLQQAALSLVAGTKQLILCGKKYLSETFRFSEKVLPMDAKAKEKEETNAQATHILDEYGNSILRLAYSYLHNMSDAEDILQDTLIQYLKVKPVLTNAAHEKAWLFKVAANLSKNKINYNHVRQADELDETLAAEEREDLRFVWEAVRLLPDHYREVIHLFHYEGYSTAQIAKLLGRKEATVRSDLRRGRQQLKTILKEAYDFEEI